MATYRDAGVDLDAAEALVGRVGNSVTATWNERVVGGWGGFAAGIEVPAGYEHPVLMMSTDGVGTKAELAMRTGRLGGLGWDLVAMCADDLVATGATPLAMTDYLAMGRLDVEVAALLIGSVAEACSAAGITLLGGETAEHPGVMDAHRFDLAGTALGVVERGAVIDGSSVSARDVMVGIDSPNLRCNGFSLVRTLFSGDAELEQGFAGSNLPLADVLLEPAVLYTPLITPLLARFEIHGMAHITGGGLEGNVARVLPEGCGAVITLSAWDRPPVFSMLAERGDIARSEMFRTFNMGIGFVLIVSESAARDVIPAIEASGRVARVIGEVVTGRGVTLV